MSKVHFGAKAHGFFFRSQTLFPSYFRPKIAWQWMLWKEALNLRSLTPEVWHKWSDLRLLDHEPLYRAHQRSEPVSRLVQLWSDRDGFVLWVGRWLWLVGFFLPSLLTKNTLPETNITPARKLAQKETNLPQPSIFRVYVSFREGKPIWEWVT